MNETRAHARLSPSAAERWMTCPGSVRLCAGVVDAGSDYANAGTACHAVLERCLRAGGRPESFVGKKIQVGENGRQAEVEFTAEMAKMVSEVIAFVRSLLKKHSDSHLRCEERIRIGRVFGCPDDLWGTADVVITSASVLIVVDAKFGYNEVAVIDNPQLLLYAIGAAADYGWIHDSITISIAQPQAGEPKQHAYSRDELLDFVKRYSPKVEATFDPDAPLVPSDDGCHWCAAAGVCPELQKRALALAQREFASIETLSPVDLATLIDHADRIRAGLEAAERHAVRLMMLGQRVPGFKPVAGDKRRAWTDEVKAAKMLRKLGYSPDDIAPRKIISPAQAEKLVGKADAEKLASLIVKPKGEPTLAREDDKRESLTPDFEPIDSKEKPATVASGLLIDLL